MITIEENSGILGMTIKGTMNTEEIDLLFARLEAKIAEQPNQKVRMYIRVIDFAGWDSFQAFLHTMKGKLRTIGKLEKYAILTDYDWVEAIAKVGDFLIPTVDVKTFDLNQKAEAIAWLKGPKRDDVLSITEIDTGAPDILGFIIDGTLSRADYDLINERMETQLPIVEYVRLYFEIRDLDGFTLQGLWNEIQSSIRYFERVQKMALVGSKNFKYAAKISNFIASNMEVRYFLPGESEDALDWLSQ